MKETPTIIPVLAALAGALVGGLITEIRQWMQLRRDNGRTLNRVLYTQLEVWHTVLKTDPEPVVAALAEIITTRFHLAETDVRAILNDDKLRALMKQLSPTTVTGELELKYQTAVDSLADVNPVLAFRLNGRPELTRYATKWKASVEDWLQQISAPDSDNRLLTSFQLIFEDRARVRLLESLEGDIVDVALLLGTQTSKRVRKTIARAREGLDDVAIADLRAVLDQVLSGAGLPPVTNTAESNASRD